MINNNYDTMMENNSDDDNDDLEGFESVAILAKRAQYKITQKPIAYSVVGGVHNAGGKICYFRFRVEYAESLGWKLGDCVDVRFNRRTGYVAIFKCEERGYKLVATSKRNGIANYRVGFTWNEDFGFPNVYSQVGCEVIKEIEGGIILRIRTEDDERPLGDTSYKDPTSVDDGGIGLTPRTLTHRYGQRQSMDEIRREMEIDKKLKTGERAKKRLISIRKILQEPIKPRPSRRAAKPEDKE